MTGPTYTREDYERAMQFSIYQEATRALAREFAKLRVAHDARVTELLDANNRFEQRARDAERTVDTVERAMRQMAFQLGDLGRERDALVQRVNELIRSNCDAQDEINNLERGVASDV